MEKNYPLVVEILRRLSRAGILDHVLLVGSWCAYLYKFYFKSDDYDPMIRTTDIDFALRKRPRATPPVDLPALLADLGFEETLHGEGHAKLENEELGIEFVLAEVGPPKKGIARIPAWGVTAAPLHHQMMLWRDPCTVRVGGIRVQLPHPADFAFHKLLLVRRRKNRRKTEMDRETARIVLETLMNSGFEKEVARAFEALSRSETKIVTEEISRLEDSDLSARLQELL